MRKVKSSKCMLMLIWVIPVIALLALLGTATVVNADGGNPDQIHVCVNPSGLTRVVGAKEKCHPSERSVHWDASGSQGGAATVIDSLGKTVGPLVQSDTVVLTTADSKRFLVGVGSAGFRNNGGALRLLYRSGDCLTEALILAPTTVLPLLQVAGTTGTVTGYYGDAASQGGTVIELPVIRSRSYNSTDDKFGLCSAFSESRAVTPARTVNLPAFTPPFSIK